jgi:hypothetical protein
MDRPVNVRVAHPSWCDRAGCTVTDQDRPGYHVSRPMVLDPDPRTDVTATVRVCQGSPLPGCPERAVFVDLTVTFAAVDATDADVDYSLIMGGERTIALGRMLVSAGRIAAGRNGSFHEGE